MREGGIISVIWNKIKGIKDSDKEILRALLPENRKKKDQKIPFSPPLETCSFFTYSFFSGYEFWLEFIGDVSIKWGN